MCKTIWVQFESTVYTDFTQLYIMNKSIVDVNIMFNLKAYLAFWKLLQIRQHQKNCWAETSLLNFDEVEFSCLDEVLEIHLRKIHLSLMRIHVQKPILQMLQYQRYYCFTLFRIFFSMWCWGFPITRLRNSSGSLSL